MCVTIIVYTSQIYSSISKYVYILSPKLNVGITMRAGIITHIRLNTKLDSVMCHQSTGCYSSQHVLLFITAMDNNSYVCFSTVKTLLVPHQGHKQSGICEQKVKQGCVSIHLWLIVAMWVRCIISQSLRYITEQCICRGLKIWQKQWVSMLVL